MLAASTFGRDLNDGGLALARKFNMLELDDGI
jgi:hypothetical protein